MSGLLNNLKVLVFNGDWYKLTRNIKRFFICDFIAFFEMCCTCNFYDCFYTKELIFINIVKIIKDFYSTDFKSIFIRLLCSMNINRIREIGIKNYLF